MYFTLNKIWNKLILSKPNLRPDNNSEIQNHMFRTSMYSLLPVGEFPGEGVTMEKLTGQTGQFSDEREKGWVWKYI